MTDTPTPDSTDHSPLDHSPRSRLARARGVLRTLLHVVGILLVVGFVAPFVVYAVPGVIGADASYVVLSDSMQPAIGVNDVVVVDAVDPATIQVGDVITYVRDPNNPPITHRVVDRVATDAGPAFVTKGDANEEVDVSPVPYSALVGKVALTIPYMGMVIRYVGTDAGFAVLVLLPIGLLALGEIAAFLRPARGRSARVAETSENGGNGSGDGVRIVNAVPAVRVEDGTAIVETASGTDDGSASDEPVTAESSSDEPVVDRLDGDQSSGIQVSKRDVTGTSIALFLLAVYAGYVGFTTQDVPSVMIAAGAGVLALLGLGARLTWPDPPRSQSGTVPLVAAPLPARAETAWRVVVGSLGALYALAETTRHPVIHDEAAGVYAVLDGDVVYWYDASPETDDLLEPEAEAVDASRGEPETGAEPFPSSERSRSDVTGGGDAYATDGSGSSPGNGGGRQ